jgi:hypothetical protein
LYYHVRTEEKLMDDSGDFSGEGTFGCDPGPGPSSAMISIMVISMLCTLASAVKTLMGTTRKEQRQPYNTFDRPPTEMLDLRIPYEN